MKKEIYDLLAGLAPQAPSLNGQPTKSPEVEISHELAFCLDTLMNTIGAKVNLSPTAMYETLLARGIDGWFKELPESSRAAIGMTPPAVAANDLDDDHDEVDAMAIRAQQAAYAQMNEALGYTPMTAHSISEKNGNGRAKAGTAKKSSRKKKVRSAKNHHRSAGAGNGGGGGGGGGRRRRSSDNRSHGQR